MQLGVYIYIYTYIDTKIMYAIRYIYIYIYMYTHLNTFFHVYVYISLVRLYMEYVHLIHFMFCVGAAAADARRVSPTPRSSGLMTSTEFWRVAPS